MPTGADMILDMENSMANHSRHVLCRAGFLLCYEQVSCGNGRYTTLPQTVQQQTPEMQHANMSSQLCLTQPPR
jgi:hypothetical protein